MITFPMLVLLQRMTFFVQGFSHIYQCTRNSSLSVLWETSLQIRSSWLKTLPFCRWHVSGFVLTSRSYSWERMVGEKSVSGPSLFESFFPHRKQCFPFSLATFTCPWQATLLEPQVIREVFPLGRHLHFYFSLSCYWCCYAFVNFSNLFLKLFSQLSLNL